jgi:hypothetical protein
VAAGGCLGEGRLRGWRGCGEGAAVGWLLGGCPAECAGAGGSGPGGRACHNQLCQHLGRSPARQTRRSQGKHPGGLSACHADAVAATHRHNLASTSIQIMQCQTCHACSTGRLGTLLPTPAAANHHPAGVGNQSAAPSCCRCQLASGTCAHLFTVYHIWGFR